MDEKSSVVGLAQVIGHPHFICYILLVYTSNPNSDNFSGDWIISVTFKITYM